MSNGNGKAVRFLVEKKNTTTVFQVLRAQDERIEKQNARVDQLQNTLSGLMSEMASLRTLVATLRSERTGTGPTDNGNIRKLGD